MCRALMWLRVWILLVLTKSVKLLSEESIFHFELFGENYHTDLIWLDAWSCEDKLYATDKLELLQDPRFSRIS